MNPRKILKKLLDGSKNVRFEDVVTLLDALGFSRVRSRGSHHIFEHLQVAELINIQNRKGQVKAYQLRQLLKLIEEYHLEVGDES